MSKTPQPITGRPEVAIHDKTGPFLEYKFELKGPILDSDIRSLTVAFCTAECQHESWPALPLGLRVPRSCKLTAEGTCIDSNASLGYTTCATPVNHLESRPVSVEDGSSNGQALGADSLGNLTLTSVIGITPEDASIISCAHFWMIETPNGPTSQGVCKLCGMQQEFRNSVSRSTWNRGIDKREDTWA